MAWLEPVRVGALNHQTTAAGRLVLDAVCRRCSDSVRRVCTLQTRGARLDALLHSLSRQDVHCSYLQTALTALVLPQHATSGLHGY
jgi:hypothetical protein